MRNRTINIALIALILFFQPWVSQAQKTPSLTKVYLSGGFGAATGTVHPQDFGLQTVIKDKWVLSLNSTSFNRTPENQPGDYIPERIKILGIPITPTSTRIYSNEYTLSGGRFWGTGKRTWLIAEAGLSVLNSETATYKRLVAGTAEYDAAAKAILLLVGVTDYTVSNYQTIKQFESGFGGVVKGQFTWAFANWAGIGVSSSLHASNVKTFLDFQFKMMIGMMNTRKGKK